MHEKNSCVLKCSEDEENNLLKIQQLLASDKEIDGIFASVEKLALSTYHAYNSLNIKIPNQLKVICFSNLSTATLLNPTLSTITQPAFEMCKQATATLLKYLEKKNKIIPNEHIVLESQLIKRASTKKI